MFSTKTSNLFKIIAVLANFFLLVSSIDFYWMQTGSFFPAHARGRNYVIWNLFACIGSTFLLLKIVGGLSKKWLLPTTIFTFVSVLISISTATRDWQLLIDGLTAAADPTQASPLASLLPTVL